MSDSQAAPPAKISFGFKKAVPGIGQGSNAVASSSRLSLDDGTGSESSHSRKSATTLTSNGGRSATKSKPLVGLFDHGEDDDRRAEESGAASARKNGQRISAPKGPAGAAPMSKAQKARLETAIELDASINDYDGVYDAMKAGERAATKQREEEKSSRDPKYMDGYLQSAEQRKLDRQRAEAKKIQREREAEGEEFKDTEAFVTDAYKQQMEEMRAAESKDKEREEADRRKSKGVAGFYKNMLADQDRAHQAAVSAAAASEQAPQMKQTDEDEASEQSSMQQRIEEARKMGLDVRLNEDNEVVDERSLLSAGINYFGKRKARSDERDNVDRGREERHSRETRRNDFADRKRPQRDGAAEARALRDAQRARQSRQMEEQMLAVQREREEAEQTERQRRKEAMMGRSAADQAKDDRIAEAKRRALERRQQAKGS